MNAKKIYMDYIEEMNNEETTRELIAYQDYADSFAIMALTTKHKKGEWTDYMLLRIDYFCNIEPIRTYSDLHEAKIALLALSYKSVPITELPF